MPAPARHRLELSAAALTVVVSLVALGWNLADRPSAEDGPSFWAMPVAAGLFYGATAALLARHGRAVVVRRVLLCIALAQAVTALTGVYADASLAAASPWPLTDWVFWLSSWLWAPAYVATGALLPLVLPDGRPLWRWAGVLSALAVVFSAVSWALTPYHLQDFPTTSGLVNPVGVDAVAGPVPVALGIGLVLGSLAVAVASVVVRWRRSAGVERDQLKWLLLGVVASVALAVGALLSPAAAGEALSAAAMLPFPAACAVALLRHRLYDVDVVLSRSLAYGLLTGSVVAGYVGAVALLGGLLGSSAGAPVLATAVVALGVLPLHTRVQRWVNRLVHGHDDDPYTALARLGGRLEAATDPGDLADHVLPELAAQVARVLRAPYAAVELLDGTRTAVGTEPAAVTRLPLLFGGREVGGLLVGGELSRADRAVLDRLGRQAAVAVHSVVLARDVARARADAAAAREEERRRLRRDLHDGMGPALAALALQAETARDLVAQDPAAATALLDRLVPRLNGTVSDVRALVHDLRPATLDELGLRGALQELTNRFAAPDRAVRLVAGTLPELPAAVDLAAYRIAGEALANTARHAGASRVDVEVRERDGALVLEVRDDGSGLSPTALPGLGLRSMRDRAEELGGSLTVGSGPAGGTVVTAVLPLVPVPVSPVARETVPA